VTKDVLNKNLMETVLALGEDPVPKIRINVCKTIDALYQKLTPGNKIKSESVL